MATATPHDDPPPDLHAVAASVDLELVPGDGIGEYRAFGTRNTELDLERGCRMPGGSER